LVEALHDAARGSASRRTIDAQSAADRRPAPIGEA
jgi:hypothetical protein